MTCDYLILWDLHAIPVIRELGLNSVKFRGFIMSPIMLVANTLFQGSACDVLMRFNGATMAGLKRRDNSNNSWGQMCNQYIQLMVGEIKF